MIAVDALKRWVLLAVGVFLILGGMWVGCRVARWKPGPRAEGVEDLSVSKPEIRYGKDEAVTLRVDAEGPRLKPLPKPRGWTTVTASEVTPITTSPIRVDVVEQEKTGEQRITVSQDGKALEGVTQYVTFPRAPPVRWRGLTVMGSPDEGRWRSAIVYTEGWKNAHLDLMITDPDKRERAVWIGGGYRWSIRK